MIGILELLKRHNRVLYIDIVRLLFFSPIYILTFQAAERTTLLFLLLLLFWVLSTGLYSCLISLSLSLSLSLSHTHTLSLSLSLSLFPSPILRRRRACKPNIHTFTFTLLGYSPWGWGRGSVLRYRQGDDCIVPQIR